MSDPEQNPPETNENRQEPQMQGTDQNAITQQDNQTYLNIMGRMKKLNEKITSANTKLTQQPSTQKQKNVEIIGKLIESKKTSQIVTKENLIPDVNQSFQKVVVDIYSENTRLKKKIEQMAIIIKEQNNKIYEHLQLQKVLKKQNQKLQKEIIQIKDDGSLHPNARSNSPPRNKPNEQKKNRQRTDNDDYDFWNMPQNQSYGKKRKDLVADSNLWINNKDQIGESVFVTDDYARSRKK